MGNISKLVRIKLEENKEQESTENQEENLQVSNEKITKKVIEDEMKESYLAYSMSVIVGRALPDVRDGLKPVHRRIMFAMNDMGLVHNKPYKKSARIVGEVLGKYHPHGDSAVYDSMVRMAQDFSLRYPLVQGQGNFGSVDGDGAAAMRYTEARLSKIAEDVLKDIDKQTVDFVPNFDGSLKEPSFLPCKIPNLLVNGSSGIAVGMATNIPPHNLTEVCNAAIKLIDEPDCEFQELLELVKGPDFPTGGTILGKTGIRNAFGKGRGKIKIRAKTVMEEVKGRRKIIVNEIPYMVNKSLLLEQIAGMVRDKRIEGISDLRDESDRDGMRIVIELKQAANEQVTLNQLFKHTRMQDTFGVIMLSLVNNEPKVLSLRAMLIYFIEHRKKVVIRRTQYELNVAKAREHILAGLVIALDDIDHVIQKIKVSKTVSEASEMLQNDYSLSEKQAKAILEMKLQKLSSLEQQKIRNEIEELRKIIAGLEEILADENRILNIVKTELEEVKEAYGDERKTQIEEFDDEEVEDEDLIKEEKMVVTLTNQGYIKRLPVDTYKSQGRGGKGVKAATTKEEDFVEELFVASTHAFLLIFTDKGKVYWKKVYKIPEAGRTAKGIPIVNLIEKEQDEKVTAVIPVREFKEGKCLFFATRNGTVKRTQLEFFSKPRKGGIIALGLDEGDKLVNVAMTNSDEQIMLATKKGRAVKFKESDIRLMGRTAKGVRGIRVKENDELVGMIIAKDENTLLTVTNKGYGKRTLISDYRLINRGGSGVINIKCTDKNGTVVAVKHINDDSDLLLISRNGVAIRMSASVVSVIGRNTQGVRVMKLKEGDELVAIAKCAKEEVDDSALDPNDDGSDNDNSSESDNAISNNNSLEEPNQSSSEEVTNKQNVPEVEEQFEESQFESTSEQKNEEEQQTEVVDEQVKKPIEEQNDEVVKESNVMESESNLEISNEEVVEKPVDKEYNSENQSDTTETEQSSQEESIEDNQVSKEVEQAQQSDDEQQEDPTVSNEEVDEVSDVSKQI